MRHRFLRFYSAQIAFTCGVLLFAPASVKAWESQGATFVTNGQVAGITDSTVAGAVNNVLVDPASGGQTAYAAAVNGGVWMTTDFGAASPNWTPLTDTALPSLSISKIAFGGSDPTYQTIYAGIGSTSSASLAGSLSGLYVTSNGGTSWNPVDSQVFSGQSITSIVSSGNDLFVGTNAAPGTGSLYVSTDAGATFTSLTGPGAGQLPVGVVSDVKADPNNTSGFYAAVQGQGIFYTDNSGTAWTNLTASSSLDSVITGTANPNTNIKLAIANENGTTVAFAALAVQFSGTPTGDADAGPPSQVQGIYGLVNGGTWTSYGDPQVVQSGTQTGPDGPVIVTSTTGLSNQAGNNLSIFATSGSTPVLYVGGQSTPELPGDTQWPNYISATNYTANLFSLDTSGTAWQPITNDVAPLGSGTDGTAPHADSRSIVVNGTTMIETDDGGVYELVNMGTAQTWVSKNGNLAVAEVQSVAYDSLTRTIIAGAQDIGTLSQTAAGMANSWTDVTQGDGGQPAVDNQSLASQSMSVRYTGNNGYAGFTRTIYTASSTVVESATTSLGYVVNSGPVSLQVTNPIMVGGTLATTLTQYNPEFYPVYRLNSINQQNIAFGGTQYLFVSHDMGETLTNLNPTARYSDNILGLSYGGVHDGVSNPGVIWVASASSVYLTENETTPNLVWTATTGQLKALATLSSDYYTTAVSSNTNVFLTQDKANFSDITGNLVSDGMTSILTLNFLSGTDSGDPVFLLAGGIGGLYATDISSTDGWDMGDWRSLSPLGSDDGSYLPNAIVTSLYYDSASDELIVGTSGRGIWTLDDASTLIAAVPEPSTLVLFTIGGLGVALMVKRRDRRQSV